MRLSQFFNWPLRAKLAAFLLVVSLLPVSALVILEILEAREARVLIREEAAPTTDPAEATRAGPVEQVTRRRILFAAAVGCSALLAGAWCARWIMAPIQRLTAATRRLTEGDLSARVELGGGAEISALGASFNAMADELSRARAGLEAAVAERTGELREANQALRSREQRLATTLHSIGDAVIVTDARGNVVRLNPIAEMLTGWRADEAIDAGIGEVFRIVNEETRAPVESPVERALRDGRIVGLANHTVLLSRNGTERAIADSAAPIVNTDGSVDGVVLVFRDVGEQRSAERALVASERKFRDLYDRSPDMYLTTDAATRQIVDCNQTLCERLGYQRSELLGQPFHIVYPPDQMATLSSLTEIRDAGGLTDIERVLRCKDGRSIDASLSILPVRASDGRVVEVRATWRDITSRKQAERDRQFLLGIADVVRSSTEVSDVLFTVCTQLATYLHASRCAFAEIDLASDTVTIHRDYHGEQASLAGVLPLSSFGPEIAEVQRRGETLVLCDTVSDPRTAASYDAAYRPVGVRASVSVPLLRDGLWTTTLVVTSPEPRDWHDREIALVELVAERVWAWVEYLRILADLRKQSVREAEQLTEARLLRTRQSELAQSLKEREILLQEIHHRVKNNLQVISSLINMQVRKLEHGPSRDALEECQTRVLAIALIHEKLYESKDYSEVHFADYARSLAASVFHALGVSPSDVTLELAIDDVPLGVDRAIPCGLVLNELVTNALKHAFKGGRKGTIRVALARQQDGRIRLEVDDDGCGLPQGFELRRTKSMGLQLVCTLAEQLDAELRVISDRGSSFQLAFKSYDSAHRSTSVP